MVQGMSSATSVLETLLKTNRPATDQERATILESMTPTNEKLKSVEGQISDVKGHIEALKLQVEVKQAEIKLQRLREEEAAILETFADHRRVFSPFRNLPEDILREISIACTQDDIPRLHYDKIPMPYILAQICSGMRHVALTTPTIWASMCVDISSRSNVPLSEHKSERQIYSILARKAVEWFERAGGLGLSVMILDRTSRHQLFDGSDSDPTTPLFDAILSYSTRWKELCFHSRRQVLPAPMIRIAALKPADVPMLQTVVLIFCPPILNPEVLDGSKFLTIPTLRTLGLANAAQFFTVNCAFLTKLQLYIEPGSEHEIGKILQQTKCLEFCYITVLCPHDFHNYKINLPCLKTLVVAPENWDANLFCAHSILEAITAPILEILDTQFRFFDPSLPDFLQRSPRIWKLSCYCFNGNGSKSLMETMEFLTHCPALTVLSISASFWYTEIPNGDRFLRAFVEGGDHGVTCPLLQEFTFDGKIIFSPETLRVFLDEKQGSIFAPNVSPWKKVVFTTTKLTERNQEILDLVSRKQAEGLDVHVR